MSTLRPEKRGAIDAVAGLFSATWHEGDGRRGAYLRLAGRRVAVEIRTLEPPPTMGDTIAKQRLRYDRVALRFVRDLRTRLIPLLARREAAIVTIRAPILQAGKTVDALEERLRARRAGKAASTELTTRAFGNRIGIRLVHNTGRGSELLGFVHSEGSSPAIIANAVQSLLGYLRPPPGISAAAGKTDRWLILCGATALGDTYRDACSQLSNIAPFEKIVLVAEGGRVETIAG